MKIARSHIAKAIEGALTTNKKFKFRSATVIYTALPTKDGVQVMWMPRWRKV